MTALHDELIAAERRWVEVYKTNDAEAFGDMLSEDFVFVSHLGEVVPRADYLSHLRERSVLLRAADPSDEVVHIFADVGIVSASYTVDESNRGVRFKGVLRTIRVWARVGDGWKAVTYQATNVRAKAR